MSATDERDLTTDIGDGIVQIRLPMAGNPLGYINGYLVRDDDGYTLVDCGWKTDDVLEALHAGLRACDLELADVKRVAVTHFHFDHYGLAGTLLRAGVGELLMHRLDYEFARHLLTDSQAADSQADEWIERNGFRETTLGEEDYHRRTELTRPTTQLEDGARIGRLTAMWTPGHSPGHLCFVDSHSGRMLTGDHVLDPITPHVGVWHEHRGDPLGDYVASLHKVDTHGATAVLPAHGEPFADLHRRVDELLAHESAREGQVLDTLAAGAADATAVARVLPWTRRNRSFESLAAAHRQFAVAETLAHLEHLRAKNVVIRDTGSTPYAYRLA